MQTSIFNVSVPLPERDEVFLMNTFTDAQLLVSRDVAALLDGIQANAVTATSDNVEAITTLFQHGFIVDHQDSDRHNVAEFFRDVRENKEEFRLTLLTTMQCNFACDYCIQGDHGDYNKHATKMSLESAQRVSEWAESRLDALQPKKFTLIFFGGEPLLNLPVLYYVAERMWRSCAERGVVLHVNIITNGLLLTSDVVDRLLPFGLVGVKVTLDGDQATHDRMRPLRGGQGTFDKIVRNVRAVAHKVRIAIGGNFDESSVDSYPALLDYLREQDFADKLVKVAFKPIIRESKPQALKGLIPLTPVGSEGKPLGGACMTAAGTGVSSAGGCDSCNLLDEKMSFLRDETSKRGFATTDGVHMGPCEIHKRHAHTVGTDGSLFACPGYAGNPGESLGHIDGRQESWRMRAASKFEQITAWHECNDCAFIPVCAGGCTVAAHTELGDMNKPNCHKSSFEAGVVTLARKAAAAADAALVN